MLPMRIMHDALASTIRVDLQSIRLGLNTCLQLLGQLVYLVLRVVRASARTNQALSHVTSACYNPEKVATILQHRSIPRSDRQQVVFDSQRSSYTKNVTLMLQ